MKKSRNILVAGILTAGLFVGCATQRETGALIERAGTGYIIDSKLDKERQAIVEKQARVNKKYNELIKMDNEEKIKREIGRFGDYEFGDKNGRVDPVEEDRAYQNFLKKWKSELYKRALKERPFIQILEGYRSYYLDK